MIALGMCATHAFADTTAGDGTLTFKGSVNAQTCQVSDADKTKTVTLPTVQAQTLNAAGDTSGQQYFAIHVTGCDHGADAAKKVATSFSSQYFDPNTGTLTSTSAGAQNVNVQLLNGDYSVIKVGDGSSSTPIAIDDGGSATMPFYAQYYATGAAGKGDVNANATFTLTYQ
ncbi:MULTISPECIES: fimbrial protein [unclassified Burkholderia]|uniref:fimbrial protein n=1 Tax=unclassified Burkholderia TaxID=2613784 RepID=UPI000755011B|nr:MULTISPECIES: fimbrial protein [unclassified Burkholderia]KUY50833.1 hypothetical protein WS45_28255 [Burkholderia sp. RF2-non_BP3]KUY82001.1 hypothetical protein WS46_15780 [Burkholderia sp. RF4-BP95]KUY95625.1 hypothetical protein WS48_17505 [Burkholderia sp. RF7-non_BP1]KUY98928.1 hypothetical protein WS49_19000 [Burkholderia sp. RF7-non_BP4]